MQISNQPEIIIIDFGGQYTHLINRRIRDLGVFAEVISFENISNTKLNQVKGVILSGGPRSVGSEKSYSIPPALIPILQNHDMSVLGICYGHQLLSEFFGGSIEYSDAREYGPTMISMVNKSSILENTEEFRGWMSHGDHVSKVSEGFTITAKSNSCPVVAMESEDKMIFGVQFHPEVTHTEYGFNLLSRFIKDICKTTGSTWDLASYRKNLVNSIKIEVGKEKVLLAVSGGVDSTVAASILHEAIGEQLHLVFVDHGLLRKNEDQMVRKTFSGILKFQNFNFVDAKSLFLKRLTNIQEPEKKRRIIGHTFIEVFEETADELSKEFGEFTFLAQGTIYSDRIESGEASFASAKIKSHHNLTLPNKMNLKIIEPLKELYKDEVRKLGNIIGVPKSLIDRYPFPGPGLAIRIIGSVTPETVSVLQNADYIFLDELYQHKIHKEIWQAFAVYLPVKAVGVQGDNRSYGNVISLRAVTSKDAMTADFAKLPHELLGKISARIINEIPDITRVVYDVSTKPPATIEWE